LNKLHAMSLAAPIAANETTPCTNANGGGEKEALLLPPTGNSIDKRLVVAETESEHRTAPSYKRVKFYTEQSHYFQVDKKYEDCGFSTRAIHAGNEPDPVTGGVVPGLELSTTFAQPSPGVPATCFDYSRAGNPTRLALERNLAAMEGARFAVALSSGMAAITTVLHLLRTGDHVLCVDDVYGGTQRYLRRVLQPHSGIDVSLVDMSTPDQLRAALRPATKLVWLETPTNPTLKCFDIREVATVCRAAGALLVVDNTFMSPYLQNPLALGADLVVHSLTKYVGGHSDTLGGGVCLNDPALYERLAFLVKSMGTGLAPFDAWLALRGAKTLALRAERAAASALALARHLAAHRAVAAVLYPGLPQHPTHAAARRNGRPGGAAPGGGGGGVLAFRVKGRAGVPRGAAGGGASREPGRGGVAGREPRVDDARVGAARGARRAGHRRRPGAPLGRRGGPGGFAGGPGPGLGEGGGGGGGGSGQRGRAAGGRAAGARAAGGAGAGLAGRGSEGRRRQPGHHPVGGWLLGGEANSYAAGGDRGAPGVIRGAMYIYVCVYTLPLNL